MGITEFLATYITQFIQDTGYISVYLLMVMESMILPVPSEAVMPFAGFLIAQKFFTFTGVIVISTFGSITGSLISYYIGYYGGEPFVRKYGKYLLLNRSELLKTEKFFNKYGQITIFVSRFIPVVRHLISLPAGFGKMKIVKFAIYTILGAGLWNAFLAWAGFYLRKNWELVMEYSKYCDIVIIVILAFLLLYFILHLVKARKANL
jgi:membrane protein DedA with SNARE-associated domain